MTIIGSTKTYKVGDFLYRGLKHTLTGVEKGLPSKGKVVRIANHEEFRKYHGKQPEPTDIMKTAKYYEVEDV